jgi:cytochrome c biogenesis protein ResB
MSDLLKSDSLLAIVTVLLGLVSVFEEFWYKIILIILAVGVVALRSWLKSKEDFRK